MRLGSFAWEYNGQGLRGGGGGGGGERGGLISDVTFGIPLHLKGNKTEEALHALMQKML